MSETSSHETKVTRATRRRIERWLVAEACQDVPAAEDALGEVFRQRGGHRPRSVLAHRIMTAAVAEGIVPQRRPESRLMLAALAVSAWTALVVGIGIAVSLALPGSPLLAAGLARAVGVLADGAHAAHVGWELIEGLRRTLLTLLASPDGAALLVAALLAGTVSWIWLGRLLAADASDASIARLETA